MVLPFFNPYLKKIAPFIFHFRNYNSELFAFQARVGEKFNDEKLREAFITPGNTIFNHSDTVVVIGTFGTGTVGTSLVAVGPILHHRCLASSMLQTDWLDMLIVAFEFSALY